MHFLASRRRKREVESWGINYILFRSLIYGVEGRTERVKMERPPTNNREEARQKEDVALARYFLGFGHWFWQCSCVLGIFLKARIMNSFTNVLLPLRVTEYEK